MPSIPFSKLKSYDARPIKKDDDNELVEDIELDDEQISNFMINLRITINL